MKQLTRKQAIAIAESGEWKDWTDEERVKLQLYQKRLCMPFDVYHKAIGNVLQRPVFTHELGLNIDELRREFDGHRDPPTFDEIVNLIPAEIIDLDEMED